MLEWQFHIDELEIDEPSGFDDIIFQLTRDPDWHGIIFEAPANDLQFEDEGADYLRTKKQTQGLKAESVFIAELRCDEDDEFEEVVRGKINFGKYREGCGNQCFVSVMIEQANCTMIMRNRYDQKVDLSSLKGFDGFTQLEAYSAMLMEMTLPAKAIQVSVEGYRGEEANEIEGEILTSSLLTTIIFRPTYNDQRFNSIDTGQLIPVNNAESTDTDIPGPMTPQISYEEAPVCFNGIFNYSFIHKGRFSVDLLDGVGVLVSAKLKVVRWDAATGTVITDCVLVQEIDLGITGPLPQLDHEFEETVSGTIPDLVEGEGVYSFLEIVINRGVPGTYHAALTVEFDEETYMLFQGDKVCDPTPARVSMINETLSRVTEAITNGCLKVKSDYYGRTDSQPYESEVDGCGALRVLTNGLLIRNAANAKHFISLKELYDGLNPIDNIGMGIEPDPARPGFDLLRVEDVSYFYEDTEVLYLPLVPEMELVLEENEHFSIIKVGYEKWETEIQNGLDEIHANREFRTSLNSVSNTKNIVSKFIAGSYPIELARQQNFADTGGADTKFDNDHFIICVERNGIYYHSIQVEQGNVTSGANFYSPSTVYNWRIRPWYNLMRWFKSVINSYANLTDTDNKLFFSQGTGNFLAEGELFVADDDLCKLENGVKAENRNMSKLDFQRQEDYTPRWKPETARLKYPITLKQYKALKANPKGYISVQCGTGNNVIKGFIKQVRYSPTKGEADLNLRLKWE